MMLRNTLYNLLGLGGPLLVAIFTIPFLIHELGVDRFGLLTLIWALVSYFGLFDFGLGRALTLQVTITCSLDKTEDLPSIVGSAYSLMLFLGLLGGGLMALVAPFLVAKLQGVIDSEESVGAIYAMSVATPFIILTSGFRGLLEARHAFGIINLIRLPMGLFTFLGPAFVVWLFEPRLDTIAWTLTAGRILGCLGHAWFATRCLPKDCRKLRFNRGWIQPLCVSGGWLTVSNVVSPLMGYVDRFMIGALVSAAAVAYYATPNEIVTKLWIIPGALTAVLFPTFSAQIIKGNNEAGELFRDALSWLLVAMAPVVMVLILFSEEILGFWINYDFASQSASILRIFALGILINSLAHIPFTLLQSSGRSRVTALIHIFEFPIFILVLLWLTTQFGVVGAAWAWFLRIMVDTALIFRYALPVVGLSYGMTDKFFTIGILLLLLLVFLVGEVGSNPLRMAVLFVALAAVSALVFILLRSRKVSLDYER